tara:strand:- start:8613 stop:10589 length:1977 start_codon:yes stop_codon:yes gene_type:complete
MSFKSFRKGKNSLDFAKAFWRPVQKEREALSRHHFVEDFSRIDQMWPRLAENHGEIMAVNAPHASHPETFTYQQLANRISIASSAFFDFGIRKGDVIAMFSENSPRWLIADQGLMRLDAINAVRGALAPIEELRYIIENSGAVALILQTADLWNKLDLPDDQKNRFKLILQLEGDPLEGVVGWESFLSRGGDNETISALEERGFDSASSSVATILYTSGTTGKPKGVPLTHENLLHQVKSLACVAYPSPGSPVLSVLPIWHSYERSAEYYFFSCACTHNYTTIKKLKSDLPKVRPIVMATVPRLWEAIKEGFDDAVQNMPIARQKLLKSALRNSSAYKYSLRKARSLTIEKISLRKRFLACLDLTWRLPMHSLVSLFIWPKVLNQLSGGQLLFPISGGGAIAPHVDLFFEALGVELLVGYGLTETSPVISCRRPWRNIRGSSGQPLPQTEFQVVDSETGLNKRFYQSGLVMVRGPQVMNGYLGNQSATNKVLDKDGWFNTGDLGMLLPDGSVVLTGRSKDTIVLSTGENIEPGPLEAALVANPLIEQVMMVGQDQKKLAVLLVPKKENLLIWANEQGLNLKEEDLLGSKVSVDLRKLLSREINNMLSSRKGSRKDERVFDVTIVEPFTVENGLLTQTLKQRREKIYQRDFQAIAAMYE